MYQHGASPRNAMRESTALVFIDRNTLEEKYWLQAVGLPKAYRYFLFQQQVPATGRMCSIVLLTNIAELMRRRSSNTIKSSTLQKNQKGAAGNCDEHKQMLH